MEKKFSFLDLDCDSWSTFADGESCGSKVHMDNVIFFNLTRWSWSLINYIYYSKVDTIHNHKLEYGVSFSLYSMLIRYLTVVNAKWFRFAFFSIFWPRYILYSTPRQMNQL
jgi:hypothetical protein